MTPSSFIDEHDFDLPIKTDISRRDIRVNLQKSYSAIDTEIQMVDAFLKDDPINILKQS